MAICRAVWRTEGERNLISPHLCGRQSICPVQASAPSRRIAEKPDLSRRIAEKPEAPGKKPRGSAGRRKKRVTIAYDFL